jgi:hypothetical protein
VEIRAWFHPGDDAPVMWSCTECKRKFVPMDLAMEKDAERYRLMRNSSMDERNRLEHYAGPALDDALDLAIEREKIHSLSYDPIAVWVP